MFFFLDNAEKVQFAFRTREFVKATGFLDFF